MLGRSMLAIALTVSSLAVISSSEAVEHPGLVMTQQGVSKIRSASGTVPLFDATVRRVKDEVDAEIEKGIDTPVPKDFSGGYTHERHKRNFLLLQQAGALFQILGDEKYAIYVRDMLLQYESMYKDLPLHPQTRSYARGKLFWQCLNDANWLVFASQAYDAIYEWLSEDDRERLESNLFRPFADFLSVENPQFFNRIHNHSTWGNAAVGMIGLVMDDETLVERALYGLDDGEFDLGARDNDGGFIFDKDGKAGFLANLEEPFSPDGYYTEGPYYQRYAMYPFLVFAQSLQNRKPELRIFEFKDGVLLKGVDALLNLTDADGEFYPLNDAQKGMSWYARELVTAVDIAYHVGGRDPQLLSIAEKQDEVLLDDAGFSVAAAIRDGKAQPFKKKSVNLRDGPNGKQGGVALLRLNEQELVFKYAAQGLSHGHYDKLSFSLYENGEELLQDYGLARFVNIEQKGGGNYLEENTTWAKQTIAHNTVTRNETSHFKGKYEVGSQHHSELHFFDVSNPDLQVASAIESNAYPGTEMRRTMALIKGDGFEKPFVLDVFKLTSTEPAQYDLPFYFLGQLIDVNFEYESPDALRQLGTDSGYEHLWLEGQGAPITDTAKFTWLDSGRFHTLTTATNESDQLLFTRIGANDPDFNLRRDAAFMLRRPDAEDTVFASIVESHGSYDPVTELSTNSKSHIANIEVAFDDAEYTAVLIEKLNGDRAMFIVSADASTEAQHAVEIGGQDYSWSGPFHYAAVE